MLLFPVLQYKAFNLSESVNDAPNSLEVNILRHPSASRPDSADLSFVNIAAFKIKDSSISS